MLRVSSQRLIDVTVARHGHVDCLVNNAGWRESLFDPPSSGRLRDGDDDDDDAFVLNWISLGICWSADPPHKPTDDVTAQEFRDLLNLNVVSYFLASKVTSSRRCATSENNNIM